MKTSLHLLFFLLSIFTEISSQTPNYLWVKSASGMNNDESNSCVTDVSGNIIATGHFNSPSISFGTITLINTGPSGTSDVFIVKYDPNGNALWAKNAGGTNFDYGKSCSVDASGNIIVTGVFNSSTIVFGTNTLTNAGASGTGDFFIAKYDPSGNVLWAKSAGGTTGDIGKSCSVDGIGNIIATGYFASSSISFGTTTLTTTGPADFFIVKYDAMGTVLWAKSASGTGPDVPASCSTDPSGNIIATGYFTSPTLTFGSLTVTKTPSVGSVPNIFIVKYDPSGNALWVKNIMNNSTPNDEQSCSTDANSNIILTGIFYSLITIGTTTLTGAGSSDIFIMKYDPNGNILWAKSAGGPGSEIIYSCSTDASNNIVTTGYFNSPTLTIGTNTLTNTNPANNSYDLFIFKHDPNGNALWAKGAGGMNFDYGKSCSVDANGNVIVTGYFDSPTISFGTTILTNADATGNTRDIFVLKLDGLTGIEEFNYENSILVFPNPSNGKINLSFNKFENVKIDAVNVFNTQGKCILSLEHITDDCKIDLSVISSGVYFIELSTENKTAIKKIVINH